MTSAHGLAATGSTSVDRGANDSQYWYQDQCFHSRKVAVVHKPFGKQTKKHGKGENHSLVDGRTNEFSATTAPAGLKGEAAVRQVKDGRRAIQFSAQTPSPGKSI